MIVYCVSGAVGDEEEVRLDDDEEGGRGRAIEDSLDALTGVRTPNSTGAPLNSAFRYKYRTRDHGFVVILGCSWVMSFGELGQSSTKLFTERGGAGPRGAEPKPHRAFNRAEGAINF